MPRVVQTARKSTGGKAPRKSVIVARSKKNYSRSPTEWKSTEDYGHGDEDSTWTNPALAILNSGKELQVSGARYGNRFYQDMEGTLFGLVGYEPGDLILQFECDKRLYYIPLTTFVAQRPATDIEKAILDLKQLKADLATGGAGDQDDRAKLGIDANRPIDAARCDVFEKWRYEVQGSDSGSISISGDADVNWQAPNAVKSEEAKEVQLAGFLCPSDVVTRQQTLDEVAKSKLQPNARLDSNALQPGVVAYWTTEAFPLAPPAGFRAGTGTRRWKWTLQGAAERFLDKIIGCLQMAKDWDPEQLSVATTCSHLLDDGMERIHDRPHPLSAKYIGSIALTL